MKIGDIVKVSKYHSLRRGEGRFFRKQYVNKKVIAIKDGWFAVIVKDRREGKMRMWHKMEV